MKAQQFLNKSAKKNMIRWDEKEFIKEYPTLYKTIIEAIDDSSVSNEFIFDKYLKTYSEISNIYADLKLSGDLYSSKKVSNLILDFFDTEYAKILNGESNESKQLLTFISLFLNKNFDKEIHFMILANMSFIKSSSITEEIKNEIRNIHF